MTNIHPIVVHFPIALFITGLVIDVIGHLFQKETAKKIGLVLVILGAVGALAAMVTGNFAEEQVEDKLSRAGEHILDRHEDLGKLTAYLLLIVAAIRALIATGWLNRWRFVAGAALAIYLIVGLIGLGTLTVTGYYGGELVYRYGAGVQLSQPTGEQQGEGLPPPPHDDDDK
jgi:uncharacterized membrane protein